MTTQPTLVDVGQAADVTRPAYVPERPDAVFRVLLSQAEPGVSDRGWLLRVHTDVDDFTGDRYRPFSETPYRRITRPGLRPPLIQERIKVLAEMGFELLPPDDWSGALPDWRWLEGVSLNGKAVTMYAGNQARRIR